MPAPLDPAALSPEQRAALLKQATEQAWRTGQLRYKLDATQLRIDAALRNNPHRRGFLLCSRRLGKSFYLVIRVFEAALAKPGARILFLAPTGNDATLIATDTAEQIMEDCPAELRPEFNAQSREFRFRNGSILRLKGTNGDQARNLRGGTYNLIVADEVATMDDFKHVLNDVCEPMLITTAGSLLLATTPPRSPSHESVEIYEQYAAKGLVSKFTLLDADPVRLPLEAKMRALSNAGEKDEDIPLILAGQIGPKGTTARREYFGEFVTDANSAVLKEFDDQARREIVIEWKRPAYYHSYVAMDPGMKDKTGILFAYHDFTNNRIVVEDEALLHGPNTNTIAAVIKEKEEALWGGKEPKLRVSDIDLRLIADLHQMHGITFQKVRKEDAMGAVNLLRNDILNRVLVINPRCVHLVRQMQLATWSNSGKTFENMGENHIDGHYDLVDAAKFLSRSINRHANPFPDNWRAMGMPHGAPAGSWVSPKRGAKDLNKRLGLFPDTKMGRRLAKIKGK